jgi:adenosine/AMP kinase
LNWENIGGNIMSSSVLGGWKEGHRMEFQIVSIEKPEEVNFILGQSHFIKTVEDLHEVLISAVPGIEFGVAFCEASGPALIRCSGTSDEMVGLAKKNALLLSAGHSFIIFLANVFPINVLNDVKNVPEVCRIFCATANPVQVILAETEQGRGILGVIDGDKSKGIETDEDVAERVSLLRQFGYKLG